jgi:hypothetical protein
MRCSSCISITIKSLFSYIDKPPFHLHPTNFQITLHEILASNLLIKPSYSALASSAENGCDLCQLFIDKFDEHDLKEKISVLETQGKATQVELSLRCFNRDDKTCTFGTLLLSCGKTMENDSFWPYGGMMDRGVIGVMMKAVRSAGKRLSSFGRMVF